MTFGLAGVLGVSAHTAQAAFSDDFSVSQTSATNDAASGFGTSSTQPFSYGARTLVADVLANTDPNDARARSAVSNGVFTFSSDDEVTGYGYVVYDFSTPISLLTTPAFQFTLLSNDSLGTLNIVESDGSGDSATTSVPLPVLTSGAPLILTVPANSVGVNTAAISHLTFYFGGTQGEDLSVDSIAAVPALVPEPGSLALLGVAAGAGAGWLIRRRAS